MSGPSSAGREGLGDGMLIRRRWDATSGDPHLMMRFRLLAIGIGLALGGLFLDLGFLIWAALAVLMLGLGLRFLPGQGIKTEDSTDRVSNIEEREGR